MASEAAITVCRIPVPDIVVHNFKPPPSNLPTEDGVPLESDWHRIEIALLIELATLRFKPREDYFVGGNMFVYFDAEQARDRYFRGPDFFFVDGVPLNPPRPYWAVWDERGRYPDVIVELTSPTTAENDFGVKKNTYEQVFGTSEYFIYDPRERQLFGWRLNDNRRYCPIAPDAEGRIWSRRLGLSLGTWQGLYLEKRDVYLRLFDEAGVMIPTSAERAEAEADRADAEKARADLEKARADGAEAEVERLRLALRDSVGESR